MSRLRLSPRLITVAIATSLAAIAARLVLLPDAGPLLQHTHLNPLAVAVGLTICFAAVEAMEISVEFRQDAYSITLAHIPMVVGLLICDVRYLLIARVLGSLVTFVARRGDPLKMAYNLASYSCEIAVTAVLIRALVAGHPGLTGGTVVVTATVVCVVDIVLSWLVFGMMRLHGASISGRDILKVIPPAAVVTTATSAAAIIAVLLLSQGVVGQALLVLALVVVALIARSYRSLFRRHADLGVIHEFVAATSDVDCEVAIADLLERTREVMSAELIQLTLLEDSGEIMTLTLSGTDKVVARQPVQQLDWLVACTLAQRAPTMIHHGTRDQAKRNWLLQNKAREALLVPIDRSAGGAVLTVIDRTAGVGFYNRGHLSLLSTLSGHLAVGLQNSELLQQLRFEAAHDPLTGLVNRTVLAKHLARHLARLRRHAESPARRDTDGLAVLLLDLDRFKEVNDTLGHNVGDQLLQVIAERLLALIPRTSTIARLGGDEFAVILPGLAQPEREAREMVERIAAALADPVRIGEAVLSARASFGIVCADVSKPAVSDADMLRHADTAMYAAKAAASGTEIYTEAMDHGRAERLALLADLHTAIAEDQFVLRYQPQFDVELGRITSVEALVRWEHPQLGLLSPDAFILLAETTGLIEPLTRIVVRRALAQCREWAEQGIDLIVGVNLSAKTVTDPGLPGLIAELLQQEGVPAAKLVLEITESAVMDDPERARLILGELAAMGITLSLDDFGTGHSSLAYLQTLPVRELKIDRAFVVGLSEDARASLLLIRSIVSLAVGLELRVVAEGIEDQDTQDRLIMLGVNLLQGYHLGRPMTPDQLKRRLLPPAQTPDNPLLLPWPRQELEPAREIAL
jgi:diguanylate cyclase (GGDEF)-like protein